MTIMISIPIIVAPEELERECEADWETAIELHASWIEKKSVSIWFNGDECVLLRTTVSTGVYFRKETDTGYGDPRFDHSKPERVTYDLTINQRVVKSPQLIDHFKKYFDIDKETGICRLPLELYCKIAREKVYDSIDISHHEACQELGLSTYRSTPETQPCVSL